MSKIKTIAMLSYLGFLCDFRQADHLPEKVDPRKVSFSGSMISVRYKYITTTVKSLVPFMTKTIKIPIYKGEEGEISEEVLTNYMEKTLKEKFVNSALASIVIKGKPGEMYKELISMIDFYGENLLKEGDRYRPTTIGCDGPACWFIWYDFEIEGINCSMMVFISTDTEAVRQWPTDIRNVRVHPKSSQMHLQFMLNHKSPRLGER